MSPGALARGSARLIALVLVVSLASGCVARTAVKTTGTVARGVVNTTAAVACTATDLVVRDPNCKG